MTKIDQLTELIFEMSKAIDSGISDPLDISLLETYQDLREIVSDIDKRLSLDETLNEILETKISRVMEIARIIQSPEYYVQKLADLKPRQIAKLVEYRQPVSIGRIEHSSLSRALERVFMLKDSMERETPQEKPPLMTGVPDDYIFQTEDSVFMKDLESFAETIPKRKEISIEELISHDDLEEFLKRFLYVVVMISRGMLIFNIENQTVLRK